MKCDFAKCFKTAHVGIKPYTSRSGTKHTGEKEGMSFKERENPAVDLFLFV